MFAKNRKDKETTITRTYEFKLRTNVKFVQRCEEVLLECQRLYNNALEDRAYQYKKVGKGTNFKTQSQALTAARQEFPHWFKAIGRAIQEDVLKRADKTFSAFFKRAKEKKAGLRKGKVGYPRFKAAHRYNSFSQQIETKRGCPLDGDKLTVPSVGTVRVRLSRPIEGTVKELRIIRKPDGWYTHLICAIPKPAPLPKTGRTTGVDVNILNKATLSDGTEFPNPRHTKANAEKLKKAQQELSRKDKGSANRGKARQKVARVHQGIGNARRDDNHKVSIQLVRDYDSIFFELIAILNLVRNSKLAKHILDVGWGQLRDFTVSKASIADKEVGFRNPAYTSKTCSRCGHRQAMPLSVRVFDCERCGNLLPRDQNAAKNVEQGLLKLTPVERSTAAVSGVPMPQVRSLKQEQEREENADRRNTTLQLAFSFHP